MLFSIHSSRNTLLMGDCRIQVSQEVMFGDAFAMLRLLLVVLLLTCLNLTSLLPVFLGDWDGRAYGTQVVLACDEHSQEGEEVYEEVEVHEEVDVETVSPGSIDPEKPMVALTFDDGPCSGITASILDTLKENNAVATFFVLGNRLTGNESLLVRMLEEGSEIGNHSYSHKQLTALSPEELCYQIEATQEAVQGITRCVPALMRPTYGLHNEGVRQSVDMPFILWSLDTLDWKSRDARAVCDMVLGRVKDGDIILMHDIYWSTAEAVKELVPELKSRGFQLVTVSQMLEARGAPLQAGQVYYREPGCESGL